MRRPRRGHTEKGDEGRTVIHVTGWPKSGCTWLTRLLGDALNCPTGGTVPGRDHKEIAAEGWDRPEPYVVRKSHFVLLDHISGPAVSRPHRLAWRNLTDERIVYIVRDPRDIAVSTAFYFEISIEESLQRLRRGWRMPIGGGWQEHIKLWLDAEFWHVRTSFEALFEGAQEVIRILERALLPIDEIRIAAAVERQSFANRRAHIREHGEEYVRGKDYNLRFMRKGVVGDWRDHFSRKQGQRAQRYFGSAMRELGYTSDDNWWRRLSRR